MNKIGLVLEGGGMRGAYTAGVLTWFIDNNIVFDYGVGISSGAISICSYYLKDKDFLYNVSVNYMSDKNNVGIRPLLKEGRYVGYKYMFDDLLKKQVKYDTSKLVKDKINLEIGLYDLSKCDNLFVGPEFLDKDLQVLKASCSLPIAGNIVDYQGYRFLDAGIKTMIPIKQSIDNGNNKHFVVITKPDGYTRKGANIIMRYLMKFNYAKYPLMVKQYANRHLQYDKEIKKVYQEKEKGNAYIIRPSEKINVKRFSGDQENLKKLFYLGYSDMDNKKEEIIKFINN